MVESAGLTVGAIDGPEVTMDRKRLINEAIHSGEMEGAYVSTEFRKDADEYVKGDIGIEELMRRTKRRWTPKEKPAPHGA